VEVAAPLIVAQVFPPSLLRDHVNVGVGFPVASTVKLAVPFELT
jgi:hypothetical protein